MASNGEQKPEPEPEAEPQPQAKTKMLSATSNEASSLDKSIYSGPDSLPLAPEGDSHGRLETLVNDRDSLRVEVTELRRSLEEIQSKHAKAEGELAVQQHLEQTNKEDIAGVNKENETEILQLRESLQDMETKHAEERTRLEKDLQETERQRNDANARFTDLLGKVNTIKSQLQERLNFDAVSFFKHFDHSPFSFLFPLTQQLNTLLFVIG